MEQQRRWAGLLRAVNVGGRTLAMADLRRLAADAGFSDVSTVLASGNVVFGATGSATRVRGTLEKAIVEHAGFSVEVLLRSKDQLERLLRDNPFGDAAPSKVLIGFLDGDAPPGLTERLAEVAVNERIQVTGAEVWLDFVDGVGRSKLGARLPSLVKPRLVTTRNVNTVAKVIAKL